MSHLAYFCSEQQCFRGGSHVGACDDCDLLSFSEHVADIYRPHRRAVIQSMDWAKQRAWNRGIPGVYFQARLGCPDAVAWVRRKKRLESGTYLTRMHWARRPRAQRVRFGMCRVCGDRLMPGKTMWGGGKRGDLCERCWKFEQFLDELTPVIVDHGDLPEHYLGTGVL
jgi:hypothetical protein